jgi:hypothetical protein
MCEAPGEGPKAARGYARAQPVIAALDSFRVANAAYPDSLEQLIPTFLPASALVPPAASQEHYPFEYKKEAADFELTFRYTGPGMNWCTFRASRRTWQCGGLY